MFRGMFVCQCLLYIFRMRVCYHFFLLFFSSLFHWCIFFFFFMVTNFCVKSPYFFFLFLCVVRNGFYNQLPPFTLPFFFFSISTFPLTFYIHKWKYKTRLQRDIQFITYSVLSIIFIPLSKRLHASNNIKNMLHMR